MQATQFAASSSYSILASRSTISSLVPNNSIAAYCGFGFIANSSLRVFIASLGKEYMYQGKG